MKQAPAMAFPTLTQIPEEEQEQDDKSKNKNNKKKKNKIEVVSQNKCRPFSLHSKKTVLSLLSLASPKQEEDKWRLAATHLSHRLVQAAAEAAALRRQLVTSHPAFPLTDFLRAAATARTAVRALSRRLAMHPCVPSELRASLARPLEARVSSAMYEDFECAGFRRGGGELVVDPWRKATACLAEAAAMKEVTWQGVLARGTRFYSEGFSGFCDRKMVAVAVAAERGMTWPETALRGFFEVAKAVWIVYLLSRCGHPAVTVFRAERGAAFDEGFMEEYDRGGGGKGGNVVKLMVAPGFYLHGGVVKCVVVCGGGGRRR